MTSPRLPHLALRNALGFALIAASFSCRTRTFGEDKGSTIADDSQIELCEGLSACLAEFERNQAELHAACNKEPSAEGVETWGRFLSSEGQWPLRSSTFDPFGGVPDIANLTSGHEAPQSAPGARKKQAYLRAGRALLVPFLARQNWSDKDAPKRTNYFVPDEASQHVTPFLQAGISDRLRALGRKELTQHRVRGLETTLKGLLEAAYSDEDDAHNAQNANGGGVARERLSVFRYLDDATIKSKFDKFPNFFQTKTSSADTGMAKGPLAILKRKELSTYARTRIIVESQILGGTRSIPADTPDVARYEDHLLAEQRAKYGVLGVWNSFGPRFGSYGDVVVELKLTRELAERVTLTRSDSILVQNRCARQAVRLSNAEDALAFVAWKIGEMLPELGYPELTMSLSTPETMLESSWFGPDKGVRASRLAAFLAASKADANALFDKIHGNDENSDVDYLKATTLSLTDNPTAFASARYVEAQIWGDLDWSNVRNVIVPPGYHLLGELEKKICRWKPTIGVFVRSYDPAVSLKKHTVGCPG